MPKAPLRSHSGWRSLFLPGRSMDYVSQRRRLIPARSRDMELIYCGRSKRRLDKKSLISLIREKGISEQEFYAWLDISVDDFAALNHNLRYETFKSRIDDYLQTGRLQPNEIRDRKSTRLNSSHHSIS